LLWGSNGFTGSPNGGYFIGADAAYADAPIFQTISGLTIGDEYTLNFSFAGAQSTAALGPNTEGWQVSFGNDTVTTPILDNVSEGFTGWQSYSNTFTATSASETLSFLALGGPAGREPFVLLDGVSLTDTTTLPPDAPEPSTMALLISGVLGAIVFSRLRKNA
jgi:hypothetical protein